MTYTEPVLALETYQEKQWYDWIVDMLDFGIANPQYQLSDQLADELHDIHLHFETNGLSSKEYQKALLRVLLERVNVIASADKRDKDVERLITAMEAGKEIHNAELLVGIFNSPKYQRTQIAPCRTLKAEILQMLSRCELTEKTRDEIEEGARVLLPGYVIDLIYCSGLLRFSHRQYPSLPDKFFGNFVLILELIQDEKIPHDMKVMLADKLEEYKYHNKESFLQGFQKWLSELKIARHSGAFAECFESLLKP